MVPTKMAFTPAESRRSDVRRAVHFVDFFILASIGSTSRMKEA
jgi:hypothetical protein